MNLSAHTRAHNSLRGAPEPHTAWRGSPFLLQLVSPVSLHSLPSIVPCHSADDPLVAITYCSSAPVSPCSHKCRSHSQSATKTVTCTFYYYLSTRSISSLRRHSFFERLDSFVLDVPSFSCVLILAALVRRVCPFVSHSNTVHITSQPSAALCSPLSICSLA